MSKHKISNREAANIAGKIADKAFEHLIEPAEARIQGALSEAYWKIAGNWDQATIESLTKHSVLHTGNETKIYVTDGKYRASFNLKGDGLVTSCGYGADLIISDADLLDKLQELSNELNQLRVKRNNLEFELVKQISGRTAKSVIENWPEAEAFVKDEFPEKSVDKPVMTTPLEMLLGKFIPALPAPQSKGV